MYHFDAMKKMWVLALFLTVFAGCSTEPPARVESNLGIKGAPDWVNKGSNVMNTKDGRMFYGVGSASPMGDIALQKATADDRARAEVARVLTSYLDVVSNDYMAAAKAGQAGDNNAGASEQIVSRQIKNTTRVNMAGARIIGSWRDPKSNTIWSIAELDMNHVKRTMAGVNDMNPHLKQYIETSADNIFDRFSKENK